MHRRFVVRSAEDNAVDAHQYRLTQAAALLSELGYVEDPETGTWDPKPDSEGQ